MYLVESVRLTVHPFVCLSVCAKKSHYHPKVFVCVSNNCAYVVDQLLFSLIEKC